MRNNEAVPDFGQRGPEPSKIFAAPSFDPSKIHFQQEDEGLNVLDCVDISESSSQTLDSVTTKIFEDIGQSNDNIACVNRCDKTFHSGAARRRWQYDIVRASARSAIQQRDVTAARRCCS